jgi:hypothetical protein
MTRMGTPWPGQPQGRGRRWRRRNYAGPRQRRRQAGLRVLGPTNPSPWDATPADLPHHLACAWVPVHRRLSPRRPLRPAAGGGPDWWRPSGGFELLCRRLPPPALSRSSSTEVRAPSPSCSISVVAGLHLGGSRHTGGGFDWWRIWPTAWRRRHAGGGSGCYTRTTAMLLAVGLGGKLDYVTHQFPVAAEVTRCASEPYSFRSMVGTASLGSAASQEAGAAPPPYYARSTARPAGRRASRS